jgi:hypothetical protein
MKSKFNVALQMTSLVALVYVALIVMSLYLSYSYRLM